MRSFTSRWVTNCCTRQMTRIGVTVLTSASAPTRYWRIRSHRFKSRLLRVKMAGKWPEARRAPLGGSYNVVRGGMCDIRSPNHNYASVTPRAVEFSRPFPPIFVRSLIKTSRRRSKHVFKAQIPATNSSPRS